MGFEFIKTLLEVAFIKIVTWNITVLGFSRGTELVGCTYIERDYYKELAHTNMEAKKFQDLHSASWRFLGELIR